MNSKVLSKSALPTEGPEGRCRVFVTYFVEAEGVVKIVLVDSRELERVLRAAEVAFIKEAMDLGSATVIPTALPLPPDYLASFEDAL